MLKIIADFLCPPQRCKSIIWDTKFYIDEKRKQDRKS